MKRSGFTLVQLIVAIIAGVSVLWALGQAVSQTGLMNKASSANTDAKRELTLAAQLIKRIGRAANTCTLTSPANVDTLECSGNFENLGNTTIRFSKTANGFECQKYVGNAWVSHIVFKAIDSFTACGDTRLAVPAAQCSSIQPYFVYPSAAAVRKDRFYRFLLKSGADDRIQSAFYVRNPGDIKPGTTYRVGW